MTVGELVFGVKASLESQFRQVVVEGEVSNISKTVAGHVYFTLSDERACVSCALFRGDALRNVLARKFKDGDKIIVSGSVGVYAKRGVFQIIAKRLSPAGKGNLGLQFELLKEKYSQLGYFDVSAKKAVPKFPKRIAVITAPYGAALQDFLKVMKRRSLWHDILIVPAVVQGAESAASLKKAIELVSEMKDIDVVTLTRGGGAMEDLWSFNHESVIEAVFNCPIPVVSAIGHQVDTTLSDLVADARMETPSAAAEFLSQPHTEIQRRLKGIGQTLKSLLYHHQHELNKRLERINPINLARGLEMRLQDLRHRMRNLQGLKNHEVYFNLREKNLYLDDLLEKAWKSLERSLDRGKSRLETNQKVLSSINPQKVLQRGFCYVEAEGAVIAKLSDYDKLKSEEKLTLHFQDGEGKAFKMDT